MPMGARATAGRTLTMPPGEHRERPQWRKVPPEARPMRDDSRMVGDEWRTVGTGDTRVGAGSRAVAGDAVGGRRKQLTMPWGA